MGRGRTGYSLDAGAADGLELIVREWGAEEPAIRSMRARLMAYSKSMPEAKRLREKFSQVSTLTEVEAIVEDNLSIQFTEPAEHSKLEPIETCGHFCLDEY